MNTESESTVTAHHFKAGDIIFQEGDEADIVYIVGEGEVELLLKDKVVGMEFEGGIIGEMALINETVRSATARAKTDCRLDIIDREGFLSLIRESPEFAIHVMRVMADRIIRANEMGAFSDDG